MLPCVLPKLSKILSMQNIAVHFAGLPNLDSIVGSLASDLRKSYGQGVSSVWIPVVLGAHDVKVCNFLPQK